jgi:hypothetical protein
MSNVVTIQCEITDLACIKAAANRDKAKLVGADGVTVKEPVKAKHKMYSDTKTGVGVLLDGWRYPVVFNEKEAFFDNYNGRWGELEKLDLFKQAYAVESVLARARSSCQFASISESQLEDGRVEVLCTAF